MEPTDDTQAPAPMDEAEPARSKKRSAAQISGATNGEDAAEEARSDVAEGKGAHKKKRKNGEKGAGAKGKGKGMPGAAGGAGGAKPDARPGGRGKTGDDMRPGSETPSNVIIARITEGDYPITIDALYMLFSFYGKVQKIVLFNKGAGPQALIQYPDIASAQTAYEQVDNRHMYTNSNLIRVGFSNLTSLVVRANNDRSWDYTRGVAETTQETVGKEARGEESSRPYGSEVPRKSFHENGVKKVVVAPVDPALKLSLRERMIAEMPTDWNRKLPGTDTCVLVVQNLNMDMVGAEALAALFGVYGDVVKIKMIPHGESALIQMDKVVQAYVCKWLLDSTPLGQRVIRVKNTMQQEIHDITAQDFKDFPLHGYGKITSPRDPSYLTSIIEPTQVLRITNIDWDTSENAFRAALTQHDGLIDVHRVTSDNDSPALAVFSTLEAAVHACILLHNQEIDGKLLYVTFSDAVPGVTF